MFTSVFRGIIVAFTIMPAVVCSASTAGAHTPTYCDRVEEGAVFDTILLQTENDEEKVKSEDEDGASLLQHSFAFERNVSLMKQPEPKLDLDSSQLGNFIGAWYLGSVAFEHDSRECSRNNFRRLAELQCPDGMCFGRYLAQQLDIGVSSLEPSQQTAIRDLIALHPDFECSVNTYNPAYFYSGIKAVSPQLGNDLWNAMHGYALKHNPRLLVPQAPTHCVVHYRVGDLVAYGFLKYGQASMVSVESMASAVASLRPQPNQECRTVEILNGGIQHNWNHDVQGRAGQTERSSWEMLMQLKSSIEKQLPSSKVFMQTDGSSDVDFFKMATAPAFVFAAGSFASAAAMAGRNNQVRSSASHYLLCPQCAQIVASDIRPGWSTFEFETIPVEPSDWIDHDALLNTPFLA